MLKSTPLKRGNSTLSRKSSGLKRGARITTTSSTLKRTGKIIQKQPDDVNDLLKNVDKLIENRSWKKLRVLGLHLFSKVVNIVYNGKCAKCGGKGTDAHHWCYTKAHNSVTDIMPMNGVLLCRKCHTEAHNDFNKFKNEVKDLGIKEYLKSLINKPIDFGLVKNTIEYDLQIIKEHEELLKEKRGGRRNA